MTSKWIKDTMIEVDVWGGDKVEIILERIDKLLRRAMIETENESLHEDILKELQNG